MEQTPDLSLPRNNRNRAFYEFFAGGGMVRCGLGSTWRCLFANDFDYKKSRTYQNNWGKGELKTADIKALKTSDIPFGANLAWASFPCQDLSLAGAGAGLKGDRSGTFWPFWNLMCGLIEERRAPQLVVLENVCGTLSSHGGKDFATICDALDEGGYSVGALVVDAELFLPQSRPRLFIVCPRRDLEIPSELIASGPETPWHTAALQNSFKNLSARAKENWVWWSMPLPPKRRHRFSDFIEDDPSEVDWYSREEIQYLLEMMSDVNRQKLQEAKCKRKRMVGGLYRRTRKDVRGRRVQRAEIRFDDVSGCLRTPAGGSSRQTILIVNGQSVKARLISSRETARLMGLPESYKLPEKYNEAYHLTGDGVVVPVVRHLAKHLFEPILDSAAVETTIAA